MQFMSIREFRADTALARKRLGRNEEVVLTANGQPFACIVAIDPASFDQDLAAIRQARAQVALRKCWASAAAAGTDRLTMEEIDSEIREARREQPQA
jgi:antitoxin (DNA-binding transcriptional repressor) of toxin-antitoxin stability system